MDFSKCDKVYSCLTSTGIQFYCQIYLLLIVLLLDLNYIKIAHTVMITVLSWFGLTTDWYHVKIDKKFLTWYTDLIKLYANVWIYTFLWTFKRIWLSNAIKILMVNSFRPFYELLNFARGINIEKICQNRHHECSHCNIYRIRKYQHWAQW